MSSPPPKYEAAQAGYPYPAAGEPGPYPTQPAQYPPPGQPGPYPVQQQPGYPPAQASQNTTVIIQPTGGPRRGDVGRYTQVPAMIVCQFCQATVTTSIEHQSGLMTWAACGGLCIVGCFCGCCLIPFCLDIVKDTEHKCPNCNHVVGRFRQFS